MDQELLQLIFQIAILVMSVVVHEVAHGIAAYSMGDFTAKYAGRLTLNPVPHLDPFGSILLPLLLSFLGGPIFGWAKPVPYNPYNLKDQKWGPGLVAAAGPLSNIALASIFGAIIRFGEVVPQAVAGPLLEISVFIVLINIVLAVFNFVPIPPLDGSKVLFTFLPYRYSYVQEFLERYGFMLLIAFIIFLFPILTPPIRGLFWIFTGISPGLF
jgi:Zn-dependent protease